ncbi:Threonine/homoserine/homoserine lactone efflux protein [Aquipseudomonas alcaligenes]|uniref:LysE family translocator n=1 Tax=Aquipseudomonas alcaligenes TaxID=43263 RepID=UPI000953A382|nr:LysE family translocator [Pseudomonas alcaligenes]SIS24480.1 Threonine/homoserine/homoserine lactone efflux protein [Pseudomonas alcaligenes]
MALHTWLIYLTAVFGLSLTPGPNGLLALTHGALYGHRRALWTISGGMLGFVLLMALSMFGLAALLKASAHALLVLKWLGAAYLIWLGIQLWRAPALHLTPLQSTAPRPGVQLFRQGLLSALSNPKVILFFGAFLPQFLDPMRSLWLQFAVMAGTFAIVEGIVEYLLARTAQRTRPWLERAGSGFNRCCGCLFAVMGLALPQSR